MCLCPFALGLRPGLCGPGGQGLAPLIRCGVPGASTCRRECPASVEKLRPRRPRRKRAASHCGHRLRFPRPSVRRQCSGCLVRIWTAADRAAANAGGRRLSEIPSLILWDTYPKRDCRLTPQFRLAFLEAPPICLRGGCTIWHSRQRCARLPASPRPGQDRLCPYLFRD